MKIKNANYINQVIEAMDLVGEAEIKIPPQDMMSVIGTVRLLGFKAYVLPNGSMKVEPMPIKHGMAGRPMGQVYGLAVTLLETQDDPTIMEVDNTAKTQANLRYHGIYSAKVDLTHLKISKSPLVKEAKVTKHEAKEEKVVFIEKEYPILIEHINNELPYTEVITSSREAKRVADLLKKTFGKLLLLRITQAGGAVVLEYKGKLPTKLPRDYSKKTINEWAKALSTQEGIDGAYLYYNVYARQFKKKLISKKGFEKLIEGAK